MYYNRAQNYASSSRTDPLNRPTPTKKSSESPAEGHKLCDKEHEQQIDNSNTVLEKIASLYAERLLSDIILEVGGKQFAAHRLILCASSDVFQVMLMNPNWSESQETKICLQEDPACVLVFPDFLKYLYTGKLHINHFLVLPLVTLADKYNVKDLVHLCVDYMCRHVVSATRHNQLVLWLQYTLNCGHSLVYNACASFITWNFELVCDMEDFGTLETDVLVTFLQKSDLVVSDEVVVFHCVAKWLAIQERKLLSVHGELDAQYHFAQLVTEVMSYVRFPMMSPRELAVLACLLVEIAVSSPVPGSGNDGYGYDVKHPGGSSRVRVRAGGDGSRSYYPDKAGNEDYISDASYVRPRYVGPHYQQQEYEQQEPVYGNIGGKAPVYVEKSYSKPAVFQQGPYYGHPTYDRSPYGPDKRAISQSSISTGPFYGESVDERPLVNPAYSNPKFAQQEYVDEPISSKFEQVQLEPEPIVIQQTASDDFSPSTYEPNFKQEQSPIDQQILIDEPKEIPVILQEPLNEKPVISQVYEEAPSIKTVPIIPKSPIVQQSYLDEVPPSSIAQYNNDDKISQVAVDDKPYPVVQQVSDDGPHLVTEQLPYDDTYKNYKKPIIRTTIGKHPSQAAYDSSLEPSFSDSDRYTPRHTYAPQPRYHFIPRGPPYQKTSHSTHILHAPSRSYYSRGVPSQKYVKPNYPAIKTPPLRHSYKFPPPPPPPLTKYRPVYPSVKLPPPPPPITKRVTPIVLPQQQEHVDTDIIFTKNPSPPQSIKLPPPPPSRSIKLPPPPPRHSIKLPPPPPPQSIKLPPPPVTKTVVPVSLPHQQEYVDSDIILAKNPPPPQLIKLPPPPVTKTVIPVSIPHQQEHVDTDIILTKNPPPPPSIKLPPPPPPQSVKLPPPPVTKTLVPVNLQQQQEHLDSDIILPPLQSIKLPPPPPPQSIKLPPPPVTKTVVPVNIPHQQEYVDSDVILTNNPPPPHSIKLPPPPPPQSIKLPPPPVTKTVIPVSLPQQQEYVDSDIISTKNPPPPHSIKLPPPPVTKTVVPVSIPHQQEYVDSDIISTKNPPPPPSIKLPPPPPPQSIKLPPPPVTKTIIPVNEPHQQEHVDIILTKNVPHSVKLPPVIAQKPTTYAKEPFYGPKTIGSSHTKLPPAAHSVKSPKAVVASGSPHVNPHFSALENYNNPGDYPASYLEDSEYSPVSHGDELPPVLVEDSSLHIPPESSHFDTSIEEKSPLDKYPPVSHSIRLPAVYPSSNLKPASAVTDDKFPIPKIIEESSPLDKQPPVSHAFRLSISPKTTTAVPNLFAAVPPSPEDSDGGIKEELQDSEILPPKSASLISPLSHSVRLPIQGNAYNSIEKSGKPKQDFPAFPVSAFKQRDPVSEKVAELTNSYNPGASYFNSNHEPEERESSPAVNEAKSEYDRVNAEIGGSFGDRLSRRSGSRFSRFL